MQAGLAAVTVYAQFFSLFYKVGLAAQVLLAAVCAVAVVWLRNLPLIYLPPFWQLSTDRLFPSCFFIRHPVHSTLLLCLKNGKK